MSRNFCETNSKIILVLLNLLFVLLIVWILRLDIFQDSPDSEKYSLYNKLEYDLRCQGKRFITLRENKPNIHETRIPPYNKNQKYSFETDENGFIKPNKIHQNPDLNIFFLGGSTTECEMVDELYRFPYLAGRLLEEKTGKKINSYNAGKSGNNSIHSINNLLNKIVPLNPDIVVRMETINDLSTLLYEATYWNKNRSRSNLSCFSKKDSALRSFKNEWAESPFRNKIYDQEHQQRIKEEYRKVLTLFVAITKASGATPVLMTQGNRIVDNPKFIVDEGDKKFSDEYRKIYTDFQEITRQVARDNKILLIDLSKEVPAQDIYFYDSVHFTDEGSKLVAKLVSEKLTKLINNKQNHVSH